MLRPHVELIQDALKLDQAVLDKVKTLVRHFKTSTAALVKLLKAQTQENPDVTPKSTWYKKYQPGGTLYLPC